MQRAIFFLLLFTFSLAIPPVSATFVMLPIEEDTYVEEKFPTISPWNNRNLFLGTDNWYAKGKNRILIKPAFSTLQNMDILPADIEKVELILTQYEYEGTDSGAIIDAYTTTTPWSMFTVTWNLQPSITSKKDSSSVTTQTGVKILTVTNSFLDAYKSFPTVDKGILLKINAETEKAMIFWAHGCDIAPSPPLCSGSADRPYFRITVKINTSPTLCMLKSPTASLITNAPTLNIEPFPSTDNENNLVTYIGRICSEVDCSISHWQSKISPGEKTTTDLSDGSYFASCLAHDGHQEQKWGSPIQFTIDTQPPDQPIIIEEAPITGSKENQIFWFPNLTERVSYQVLSSERSDFRSYNTYSPWVSDNHFNLVHVKEKLFYYKVKARDLAGNESSWSEATSTFIDVSDPLIRYFKTNKTLLSPKIDAKGNVSENAYIQGGMEDATTALLKLEIRNKAKELVYIEEIEEKNYLWTHWPDKKNYPDGIYTAQLIALDAINHISVSEPLLLTLDTKPPPIAVISGIKDKQITNTQTLTISVSCKELSLATVYLGGRIVASNKTNHLLTTSQKDGSHTLSASCTDAALNKSNKTITFTVDTTPPSPPSLSYSYSAKLKKLQIKFYCREKGNGELFVNGSLLLTQDCQKNSYVTYTYEGLLDTPHYATYTARLSDAAGNKSGLAERTVFINGEQKSQKQNICSAIYEMQTSKFSHISCNWEWNNITYVKTNSLGKDKYLSEFNLTLERSAKVNVTVMNCKQLSLWDPRTWVSCVREVVQEQKLEGKITPIITSTEETSPESDSRFQLYHGQSETVVLRESYLLQFSLKIAFQTVFGETISPTEQVVFSPIYVASNKPSPYFSWLFSTSNEVSQWHGNTAYQRPHGGIDFSVSNEKILAPEKGIITSVGYDNKTNCNSGGNYLGIKHPNGLYTYYFHIASTKYSNGTPVKKGDTLAKGKVLVRTGNTGRYNCEPLAAHLHFEVRTSTLASTHVNPVPYFNIDWNKIRTSRASTFPGRLTGDNPHPKF